MRTQVLPKELWTGKFNDKDTYCYWYVEGVLHTARVNTVKEAYDFVQRAKEKNVAAFASAYVPKDKEHEVIAFADCGNLAKYGSVDRIVLSISRAYNLILNGNQQQAEENAFSRTYEQHGNKQYKHVLNANSYEVSWFTTNETNHVFRSESFVNINDALAKFNEFQNNDIPCRLIEIEGELHGFSPIVIHEIKAANQHWFITMGLRLESFAKNSLPLAEIPYIFSNSHLMGHMEIKDNIGYLDFYVGSTDYTIIIKESSARARDKGVLISIERKFRHSDTDVCLIVINNPITDPWINRIRRG